MFSLAFARNLVQLQNISIRYCDQLDVFVSDIGGGEHGIASAREENEIQFPKLTSMKLKRLSNFSSFCKPMDAIKSLQLKHLELEYIPKINCLWPASETNYETTVRPLFSNKVFMLSI